MEVASFSLSFSSSEAHSAVLACVFYPQETTCQTAVGIETFSKLGFCLAFFYLKPFPKLECTCWKV